MKFCIFILLLLASGCSRQEVQPYDSRRSLALLDACDAIIQDDTSAAIQALERMEGIVGQEDFITEMRLAVMRRQDFEQAESLLRQRDYQGLRQFLTSRKANGEVGVELTAFESLPDALEQLELFCSRMPWEESGVLKDALARLEPQVKILSESPSFQEFYQEQLATLKRLKVQEAQQRAQGYLHRLAQAAVSGDMQARGEALQVFRADQPEHFYFRLEKALLAGGVP